MARGIAVRSRRAVQCVALLFAAALVASAYFYVTEGQGTPFPGCWPPLARGHAVFLASAQIALAIGFVIAALRDLEGPSLKDPLLIGVTLTLFALIALNGGTTTIITGLYRVGQSGCFVIGAPWSYGIGVAAIVLGSLALYAATILAMSRDRSD